MISSLLRVHMLAPFHTVPSEAASHCAFTGKVLRFAKMMKPHAHVIEYANEGSESDAAEHVPMLTPEEYAVHYPRKDTDFWGNHAIIGSTGYATFCAKLLPALGARVVPRTDIIAHPFGRPHEDLVRAFPENLHIETGIGYTDGPIGGLRIYESECWRHLHWGKHNEYLGQTQSKHYSWVIPNYFDLEEWPVCPKPPMYPRFVFMGRISEVKGILEFVAIVKKWFELYPESSARFAVAGQGDWAPYAASLGPLAEKVEYVGPLVGRARAAFIGKATASLMPTQFVEPFGGSGVEGLLCGTPLLAVDYGAFTETVQHGVNGYRCSRRADWIAAIERAADLDRVQIANAARAKYSLEAVAPMYVRAFSEALDLWNGEGWVGQDSWMTEAEEGAKARP